MNYNPGTFGWAWQNASGVQRKRYYKLESLVTSQLSEEECKWLLWMAGMGLDNVDMFVSMIKKDWKK